MEERTFQSLRLSTQAQAIIAGLLDPDTVNDSVMASEDAWLEVRAMFPPVVYHRMVGAEGIIGGTDDKPKVEAGAMNTSDGLGA